MFQEFKNTVRMFSERCAPILYKIVAAGRVMACHNGRASLVHFRDFGCQNGNRFYMLSLKGVKNNYCEKSSRVVLIWNYIRNGLYQYIFIRNADF